MGGHGCMFNKSKNPGMYDTKGSEYLLVDQIWDEIFPARFYKKYSRDLHANLWVSAKGL